MQTEVVASVITIFGKEWRLNESKHVWRGDGAVVVVLCPSVVAQVVAHAGVGNIQLGRKAFEQLDVSVEADVQAVEAILLGCRLGIGITQ